ncbi:MAG: septum site-determining protein MinC [Halothermotrichaceae bacterium]
MKEPIAFKASSKGVIININPEKKFAAVKEALQKKANDSSDFFAGVDLYLNMSGCILSAEEMQQLLEVLSRYEKVEDIYFLNEQVKTKERTMDTILVNRTLRSGQSIKYPSNIVVIGDVNPGAEIISGGDILVVGNLRGVVHAGASGSSNSQVIALKLQPTQLRIGNVITRSPDQKAPAPDSPERAYIKDGVIVVEELKTK